MLLVYLTKYYTMSYQKLVNRVENLHVKVNRVAKAVCELDGSSGDSGYAGSPASTITSDQILSWNNYSTSGITANSTNTLTNKTLSGANNTFSNIPYSALTDTPVIPNNTNYVDLTTAQTVAGAKNFTGAATFGALLTVGNNIIPSTAGTGQVGTTAARFATMVASQFLGSSAATYFGNATANQPIYFRQGTSTSVLAGGFHGNGNFFLQTPGVAPTDNSAGLQVLTNITANSGIARGSYFTQNLTAVANNDALIGIDVNPTFTLGAFTGVTSMLQRWMDGTTLRSFISPNGIQEWYLSTVGSIRYGTPSSFPGIIFYNSGGTGRSQIRQLAGSGGLAFGSTTGSTSPASQLVIFTDGNVGMGTNAETNTGQKLQVGGTGIFTDTLTLTGSYTNSQLILGQTNQAAQITLNNGVNGVGSFTIGYNGAATATPELLSSAQAGLTIRTNNATQGDINIRGGGANSKVIISSANSEIMRFDGSIATITGDLIPNNGSRNIGSAAANFAVVNTNRVVSNVGLVLASGTSGLGFEETNSTTRYGGFFTTTHNYYLQAPGALQTDSGERLQVYGKIKVTDDVLFTLGTKGIVMIDRGDGLKKRLVLTNNVVTWETVA